MLPNLLIPGPGKTGTSFLASSISQHPDIYMIPEKEIHFFSLYNSALSSSFDEFIAEWIVRYEFKASHGYAGQRYLVDASPSSFAAECGSKAISDTLGEDVKALIVIRNPAERAFSEYIHHVINCITDSSFSETLREKERFLSGCYYSDRLEKFMDSFPGRCHVIRFDDMAAFPKPVFAFIFKWLDLPPFEPDPSTGKNVTAGEPVLFGTLDEFVDESFNGLRDSIDLERSVFLKWRERNSFTFNASEYTLRFLENLKRQFTPAITEEEKIIINKTYFERDILRLERITGYNLSNWLGK